MPTRAQARSTALLPYLKKTGTATQLIVDGRPFVMLSGEVHNSSGSSLEYMEQVWDRLTALHCNSAIVPVSWELIEPVEGKFDFSLVDGLVRGARAHDLKLAILWFGTWKNTHSTYTPAWVKQDAKRFFLARDQHGRTHPAVSCVCEAGCQADARAFAALMRHLKKVDGKEHTVVMVQVENETGLLSFSRDFGPEAQKRFDGPVPEELMRTLQERKAGLIPELADIWKSAGNKTSGTWSEVFGEGADEIFMAWHIGRYVGAIAAAGKKEYGLPLFVNCWLVQFSGEKPGQYPSGGPVSRVMDIWRAAAPQIDIFAPDIYLDDFKAICASYTRSGNPLLIPEANRDERSAANAWYAVGNHDAICFAPFGFDSIPESSPIGKSYSLLDSLLPVITRHHGDGSMKGFVQQDKEMETTIELGDFRLHISYIDEREKGHVPGCGLAIALQPDEYLIAGSGFKCRFLPREGVTGQAGVLAIDEGTFRNGKWIPGRRLNGDELSLWMPDFCVRNAKLYYYD